MISSNNKYNIDQVYLQKQYELEDSGVLHFLKNLSDDKKYLEVGAGTGRFIRIVKDKFNFSLYCLEINNDLAKSLDYEGFKVSIGDIRKTPYSEGYFDIVHCSHLIEHLGYPDISNALDELVRITKPGGYIIIRSPLMHPDFYWDIDHVRPYPPNSIMTYFSNPQQQKKGSSKIKKIDLYFRYSAYEFSLFKNSKLIKKINFILKKFWNKYYFPKSRPNGYVLILQKIV